MVKILALVMHRDEQAVLTAVDLARESGVSSKLHGPGTGKTRLAAALTGRAIMHLHRCVFLFDSRACQCAGIGEPSGQTGTDGNRLIHANLVTLDELLSCCLARQAVHYCLT